jgi:polar amino acid transport system substrate-binding protein
MKITQNKLLLLLFILSFQLNFASNENNLKIITGEFPPLSYTENGVPKGVIVELANLIQNKLGTKIKLDFYPWARGYNIALNNKNILLFSTTKTEERTPLFKWVGPIVERHFNFYKSSNSNISISSFESAKKYRIGVMLDSCNDQFLTDLNFPKLDKVVNESFNIKKLITKRIDLIYTDNAQVDYNIIKLKNSGFNFQGIEITECYTASINYSYFAFSLGTSDEVVKKWQSALNELYADGTVLKLFQKYNLEKLYFKKSVLPLK